MEEVQESEKRKCNSTICYVIQIKNKYKTNRTYVFCSLFIRKKKVLRMTKVSQKVALRIGSTSSLVFQSYLNVYKGGRLWVPLHRRYPSVTNHPVD